MYWSWVGSDIGYYISYKGLNWSIQIRSFPAQFNLFDGSSPISIGMALGLCGGIEVPFTTCPAGKRRGNSLWDLVGSLQLVMEFIRVGKACKGVHFIPLRTRGTLVTPSRDTPPWCRFDANPRPINVVLLATIWCIRSQSMSFSTNSRRR